MKVKMQLWHEPEIDYELTVSKTMNKPLPNSIDEMSTSLYYKAADLPKPALLTIKNIEMQIVKNGNGESESLWIMSFIEAEKTLILKAENRKLTAHALGSRNPHDWLGQKSVLYNNTNITYGANVVGWVRIRAPKNQPQPDTANQPQPDTADQVVDTEFDDDIPF